MDSTEVQFPSKLKMQIGGDEMFISSLVKKMESEEANFVDNDIQNCFISTITCLAIDNAKC